MCHTAAEQLGNYAFLTTLQQNIDTWQSTQHQPLQLNSRPNNRHRILIKLPPLCKSLLTVPAVPNQQIQPMYPTNNYQLDLYRDIMHPRYVR